MRSEDRERALTEVRARVVERVVKAAQRGATPLDEVLAESIYQETRRIRDEADSARTKTDKAFWGDVKAKLWRSSERTQKDLLDAAVGHYAQEVVGNFDPKVYQAVTRAGPPALGLLLNAVSPRRILRGFPELPSIDDAMVLQGEIEHIRRLRELGTVILVPTHVSNLDSIIIGFAIYKMGLPPFIYGAGLNLFSSAMIGYFMHNLGAYTVDRKKTDPLYKDVLKTYAGVTLELGYDNIFFPGGTRARSGAVEGKLKLGLLGAGISAYVQNLVKGAQKSKIFIVPATLSYELVLEAETLIDDFLKDVGKSRYIISDDEFSQPRRVFDFVTSLLSLESKIYVTVSRGMDPFGNPVNDDGESLDPMGRSIDTKRYVLEDGVPVEDDARDAEYTREVGERVVEAFLADTVLMPTHVVARAVFGLLRKNNKRTSLIRLVRGGGQFEDVELSEVYEVVDKILGDLRALENGRRVRLDPKLVRQSAEDVVSDGIRHFAIYHTTPAVTRKGDRLFATDRNLLFYYQNRLEGFGVWPEPELTPALSADRRSLGGVS
ncbi:MAG: 1-acyl-sn-glycerol-3-phosphate acyltransferase [Myxococcota bacterium]